ncbi:MAG: MBOAT family protein [Bacteroidetes bacterium]|nr:MAG: MBOAT family protein [Bacteroidota bacterium]
MLFSSTIFLFLFLPITIIAFYLVKGSFKNLVLLIASMVFYAWGGVSYTAILIISILFNYLFGYLISQKNQSKLFLGIGVSFNLLILVVFKYTDFIVQNINKFSSSIKFDPINQPNIILPIGISFFTFQAISYLVDIYRKEVVYQKSMVNLALYISLFPQLIAGPIVRYHDIAKQLVKRTFSLSKIGEGVERFIIGLSKKVLLANSFALVADKVFASDYSNLSTPTAWLGIIAYSFQIYFDFSGYSDMAIGLGKMFGFDFLENFNFPYISKTIKEFWRRWHISLSTWFRDYLYIPLGGSRVSVNRVYLNLLIVFTLTGFWHGASWSFLFWGLFHGFFLIIERLGLDKLLSKLWIPFQHIYALFVVIIGWVFFRVEYIRDAFYYIGKLFYSDVSDKVWQSYFDFEFIIVFVVAILGSSNFFPWLHSFLNKFAGKNSIINNVGVFIYVLLLLLLFVVSSVVLLTDSYNPFIYFRF